jgi:hypothetical protein
MPASCRDYQLALVRSACPADAVIEVLLHDKLGSVQAPNRTGADIDGVGCYCCGFSLDHFLFKDYFSRGVIIPPSEKRCLAQLLVIRPFRISDFADQHWPNPLNFLWDFWRIFDRPLVAKAFSREMVLVYKELNSF